MKKLYWIIFQVIQGVVECLPWQKCSTMGFFSECRLENFEWGLCMQLYIDVCVCVCVCVCLCVRRCVRMF